MYPFNFMMDTTNEQVRAWLSNHTEKVVKFVAKSIRNELESITDSEPMERLRKTCESYESYVDRVIGDLKRLAQDIDYNVPTPILSRPKRAVRRVEVVVPPGGGQTRLASEISNDEFEAQTVSILERLSQTLDSNAETNTGEEIAVEIEPGNLSGSQEEVSSDTSGVGSWSIGSETLSMTKSGEECATDTNVSVEMDENDKIESETETKTEEVRAETDENDKIESETETKTEEVRFERHEGETVGAETETKEEVDVIERDEDDKMRLEAVPKEEVHVERDENDKIESETKTEEVGVIERDDKMGLEAETKEEVGVESDKIGDKIEKHVNSSDFDDENLADLLPQSGFVMADAMRHPVDMTSPSENPYQKFNTITRLAT